MTKTFTSVITVEFAYNNRVANSKEEYIELLDGARFEPMDNGWGRVNIGNMNMLMKISEDEAKEKGFDEWEEEDFKK